MGGPEAVCRGGTELMPQSPSKTYIARNPVRTVFLCGDRGLMPAMKQLSLAGEAACSVGPSGILGLLS